MESSGIDHRETIALGTPALIKERDKPITPSPEIFPRLVSQALRTTNSVLLSFKSKISLDVSKPLSLPSGARAIAPGILPPVVSSSKPWVARWIILALENRGKIADFVALLHIPLAPGCFPGFFSQNPCFLVLRSLLKQAYLLALIQFQILSALLSLVFPP